MKRSIPNYISSGHNSTQKTAIKGAMQNLDAQTDMYDATASAASTDVLFKVGTYKSSPYSGWYAWTQCTKVKNNTICNQNTVTRNNKLGHSNQKSLYCHEIGHTVGLGHGPAGDNNRDYKPPQTTCMRGNPDVTKYADIDVQRINNRY